MTTRLPSLHGRLTTFASGPWMSDGPTALVDSIDNALDTLVDGVELAVQVTRDGIVVVSDSGRLRSGLRRRRIEAVDAADLPPGIPTLTEVFDRAPAGVPLLVTVQGAATIEPVLATAQQVGAAVEENLWLVGDRHEDLVRRRPDTKAKLLLATGLGRSGGGPEKLFATLHGHDLDGLTTAHGNWTGGTVTLAHRFGLLAHASGARHDRELAAVIDAGIDAVSAEDPHRLAAVAAEFYP